MTTRPPTSTTNRWTPVGLALLLAALCVGEARWAEAAPRADADGVVDTLGLARRALSGELSRSELRRLMRRAGMSDALEALLEGFDGDADSLRIERTDDGSVVLHAAVRERRQRCYTPPATGEQPDPETVCYEEVETTHERSLTLDPKLWKAPRKPRKPRKPEAPPAAEPQATPTIAPAPAPQPSLIRLRGRPPQVTDLLVEPMSEQLAGLHVGYQAFQEIVETTYWRDPFSPGGLDTPARVAEEAFPPPPVRELPSSNSEAHMANPFSDHRLGAKLDMPPPPVHTARYDAPPVEQDVIDTPDLACLRAWAAMEHHHAAPRLACFRAALKTARLGRGPYEAASWMGALLPSPFNTIAAAVAKAEYESARDETVSHLVWGATWLAWVERNPLRLPDVVAALTADERRQLRRRLYRWWHDDAYRRHSATIATIFEEHLGELYPATQGDDGQPARGRFRSDFLWGTNWLAAQRGLEPAAVRVRFHALTPEERGILAALAGDARLRRRFRDVAAIIAPAGG